MSLFYVTIPLLGIKYLPTKIKTIGSQYKVYFVLQHCEMIKQECQLSTVLTSYLRALSTFLVTNVKQTRPALSHPVMRDYCILPDCRQFIFVGSLNRTKIRADQLLSLLPEKTNRVFTTTHPVDSTNGYRVE